MIGLYARINKISEFVLDDVEKSEEGFANDYLSANPKQ
jgi:hypothetical protein